MDIGIHFDKDCVEALIRYVKNKLGQEGEIGHEEIIAYETQLETDAIGDLRAPAAEAIPMEMAAGQEN